MAGLLAKERIVGGPDFNRWLVPPAGRAAARPRGTPTAMTPRQPPRETSGDIEPPPGSWVLVSIAWTLVGLPLAWGAYKTLQTAVVLFR